MQSRITGTTMPVLEFVLDPNEAIISEAGELSWMASSIQMTTHTQFGGGGGIFGVLKRVAGGGSGSVTSVALTMPAEFTVTGSPIVGAGTLAVTKAVQAANLVFAGPTSGGSVVPTFRGLVAADLPAGTGTVTSVAYTLAVPAALFNAAGIAGSPITTNGTIAVTLTLANQTANTVFAGAASGGAAPPTFRALVPADMPTGLQFVSISRGANRAFGFPCRSSCRLRAAATSICTSALVTRFADGASAAIAPSAIASDASAGTSTPMSMRSRSGPDTRLR